MPDGTSGVGGKAPTSPVKPLPIPVQTYRVGTSLTGEAANTPSWSMAESFQPLNSDRFVSVGSAHRDDASGKVSFPILDLTSGAVSVPDVTAGPDIPGHPSLIYYDAQKSQAGLWSGYGAGATQYRYAHWDLGTGKVDWTVPVAEIKGNTFVRPIGVDPKGQYFYFMKETNQSRDIGQYAHADQATIGRVDLQTHQVDWTHSVPLPGRSGSMDGGLTVQASPDYTHFAVVELNLSTPADGPDAAHGFVIDVTHDSHAMIDVPPTPYAITFDRENRYLAIADNKDAKLYRYDLATNKQDMVVGTVGRVQTLALTSDNSQLYVFTKGRTMETREWPSLKPGKTIAAGAVVSGQTHFNGEGMAVLPDGKHAVMTKTEAPYGFPATDEFFSMGIEPQVATPAPVKTPPAQGHPANVKPAKKPKP